LVEASKARQIIVTGAHRSGTSAISNFLAGLGIDVGDPAMMLQQAQDNPKGFFERLDVLSLNDDILRCANSSWDRPDMRLLEERQEIAVTDDIHSRIQHLLGSFQAGDNHFLLKDPRFSLTLPVWQKHLAHPLVIICIRNPLETARSLQKRNGFSIYKSLAIWEAYLCRLLANCRDLNCLFVHFNRILKDPLQYGTLLAEGLAAAGILVDTPVAEAVAASFDAGLRHEEHTGSELEGLLSARQLELWKILEKTPEDSLPTVKDWSFHSFEGFRQKDTDIGYARLEIKLLTESTESGHLPGETTLLVGKNERFSFEIDETDVRLFRLFPLNVPCVIRHLAFEVVSGSGQRLELTPAGSNGSFDPKTSHFYFPGDKPEIIYQSPFANVERVIVEVGFATFETERTGKLLLDYFTSGNRLTPITTGEEQSNLAGETERNTAAAQRTKTSWQKNILQRVLAFGHLLKMVSSPGDFVCFLRLYKSITRQPAVFSPDFYLQRYEDVTGSRLPPLVHFFVYGWKEGRDPSPDFSTSYYLQTYRDVAAQGLNPLLHYLAKGWMEGRNPSASFDTNAYIGAHPEILSKKLNPLVHKGLTHQVPPALLDNTPSFVFEKDRSVFSRPVTVIIPVYLSNDEAVRTLRLLMTSLSSSYPVPLEQLLFIIVDDASPIPRCKTIMKDTGFFGRPDLKYYENSLNQGFTRTVNGAIKEAGRQCDIVILNSDTEIYGPVFETLQRACHRRPKTGSVTPLSNRATIASLTNWPYGADTVYSCSPRELSETVQQTGLVGPEGGPPTGHGFCMYMAGEAIREIGLFDEKTFAQGYGEENDWSMRAIIAGFTHHICTECFVFHHESRSFAADLKSALQQENTGKLNARYPYYPAMVQDYIGRDPLRHHRMLLRLFLSKRKKENDGLRTLLYIMHDSFNNHEGGVQQHVKQLINSLRQAGLFEVMVLSPCTFKGELYEIHLFQKDEYILLKDLGQGALGEILHHLGTRVDYLHLHHTHGLADSVIEWVRNIQMRRKVLTIHDYDFFCCNPFLLNDDGLFCLSEKDRGLCSNRVCEIPSTEEDSLLPVFDKVLVPSDSCRGYIGSITPDRSILEKISVLPHFLTFAEDLDNSSPQQNVESTQNRNIIFLGSLFPHKGGEIFLQSLELLEEAGFHPLVWGQAQDALLKKYTKKPEILPYRNWRELLELYLAYGAHIVVIPAVCAETFSYTLFEALFLFEVPVVVGPYGNPADVVRQHGVGEVLPGLAPTDLAATVAKISGNYQAYQDKVRQYKSRCLGDYTKARYLGNYLKEITGTETALPSGTSPTVYPVPAALSPSAQRLMNRSLRLKGKRRMRVLIVHALSKKDPPFFFRVENPQHYLEMAGHRVDSCNLNDAPLQPDKYDLIYLSRTPLTDRLAILLDNAERCHVPTVLDVDDLVFHSDFLHHFYFLDKASQQFARYRDLLGSIERTFEKVDVLLGSTPEIAAAGEKYGKTSIYFRNRLRFSKLDLYKELFETRPRHKEFDIGYFAGSSTHDRDFELLIPALTKIVQKRPRTKILLMGFVKENTFTEKFATNIVKAPFDDYGKYLRALQRCKVVAVPVSEINPFAHAKSNIKFIEAAAVGTPVISSPISEMRYSIESGLNGWIAEDNQQWIQYVGTALMGNEAEYAGERANCFVSDRFSGDFKQFNRLLLTITVPGLF
jgi:glycosyltransferase involved in cell wall biosynthesis/GT2 family glycosyltransferase